MGMSQNVLIILLLVMLAGGAGIYIKIKRKIRMISRLAFGTDSLLEGIGWLPPRNPCPE